jgi:hypothetical protein
MRFLAIFALVLVTITPLLCSDFEEAPPPFHGMRAGDLSDSGDPGADEVSFAAQPPLPPLTNEQSPAGGVLVYPPHQTNQGVLQPPFRLDKTPPPLETRGISPHLMRDPPPHPHTAVFETSSLRLPPAFGSLSSRASAVAPTSTTEAPQTGLAGKKRRAAEDLSASAPPPPPAPTLRRTVSAELICDVFIQKSQFADVSDSWTDSQKAFFLLALGNKRFLNGGTLEETTNTNNICDQIEHLNDGKKINEIMKEFCLSMTLNNTFQKAKDYMHYFITNHPESFKESDIQGTFWQYLKLLDDKCAAKRLDMVIELARQSKPLARPKKGTLPLASLNKIYDAFDAKRYADENSLYGSAVLIFAYENLLE